MKNDNLEKYRRAQEKFGLPDIQILKEKFNIELKTDEKLFDQIRNDVSESIFNISERILEPLVGQPESFSCLFEQDMVTDEERMKLFELYKKIQTLKWEHNLLLIHPDEKKTVEWISRMWHFWDSELEHDVKTVCKKLSMGWQNLSFSKEKTYYHW